MNSSEENEVKIEPTNFILREPTRTILLYVIKIIHLLQSFIFLIGPYIIDDHFLLSVLILGYVLLIICWYLFGHCIYTPIEQYLESNSEKFEDGSAKSFISVT